MQEAMFHLFQSPIEEIPLPEKFTYPFCYTPHPLCVKAAEETSSYLRSRTEWQKELEAGKMFGVLVVQDREGRTGYLAAFSGLLAGKSVHPFFVPPVYDLQERGGFFRPEEQRISLINHRIQTLENDPKFREAANRLDSARKQAEAELQAHKETMKQAKAQRDIRRREETLTPEEQERLVRESQFLKAEHKRMERAWLERIALLREPLTEQEAEITALKEERRQRSTALQQRLFSRFRMLNARGEEASLCDLFSHTLHRTPPAGAGECAAPKLLQQAYLHGWKPLCMAEFWWGESPRTEIRLHGHYYPACKSKCEPILNHMLQGLEVDENPMPARQKEARRKEPEIVYEDRWIIVLDKPSGLLSVPGKVEDAPSVYGFLRRHCSEAEGPLIVHRLDMDTSGLLVAAKSLSAYRHLQAQFRDRTVRKCYIALLEKVPAVAEGIIDLPLSPDLSDRPRQQADPLHGKPAVTRYKLLGQDAEGHARIAFYPVTGRTHQLRVHAAHPSGLHCPIVGDTLYGKPAGRLCLHAASLEFTHPVTGERMKFQSETPMSIP